MSAHRKSKSGWQGAIAAGHRRIRGQRNATTWATRLLDAAVANYRPSKPSQPGLSGLGVILQARIQEDLAHRHVSEASYRIGQLFELCQGQISRDTLLRQADRLVALGTGRLLVRGHKGRGMETEYVFRLAESSSFAAAVQERSFRAHRARGRYRSAKKPQIAPLLPPSESVPTELPPTEATPTPLRRQRSTTVAVAPLKGSGEGSHPLEVALAAQPGYQPWMAKKILSGLSWKAEDVHLVSRTLPAMLASLCHESRNPMGVLLHRLQHQPGRVLFEARRITSKAPSIDPRIRQEAQRQSSPLQQHPQGWEAYLRLRHLQTNPPAATDAGYLDHLDQVRELTHQVLRHGEGLLGREGERLRTDLLQRLHAKGLSDASPMWARAWTRAWSEVVFRALELPWQ